MEPHIGEDEEHCPAWQLHQQTGDPSSRMSRGTAALVVSNGGGMLVLRRQVMHLALDDHRDGHTGQRYGEH